MNFVNSIVQSRTMEHPNKRAVKKLRFAKALVEHVGLQKETYDMKWASLLISGLCL